MVPLCNLKEVWRMLVRNCTWIFRELTSPDLFITSITGRIAYCETVQNNRRNASKFWPQAPE
jgi:hypothetical protein